MKKRISINLEKFRTLNVERCESQNGFNHKINSWSEGDWIIALTGEYGEAMNCIKKLNRIRDNIPGNKESELEICDKLAEELADCFCYLDLLAASNDRPLIKHYLNEEDEQNKTVVINILDEVLCEDGLAAIYYLDYKNALEVLFSYAKKFNINLEKAIIDKFNKVSFKIGFEKVIGKNCDIN